MAVVNIKPLLNQTLELEAKSAETNKYGQYTFGEPQTLKCRFEQTNKTIRTPTKEWEPIDGIVFIGPAVAARQGDRVTYNEVQYRIMKVSAVVVGSGQVNHYELMVQEFVYSV